MIFKLFFFFLLGKTFEDGIDDLVAEIKNSEHYKSNDKFKTEFDYITEKYDSLWQRKDLKEIENTYQNLNPLLDANIYIPFLRQYWELVVAINQLKAISIPNYKVYTHGIGKNRNEYAQVKSYWVYRPLNLVKLDSKRSLVIHLNGVKVSDYKNIEELEKALHLDILERIRAKMWVLYYETKSLRREV